MVTRSAELAQLVERTTLNRVVEGSIPSFGVLPFAGSPSLERINKVTAGKFYSIGSSIFVS